MSIVFCVSLIVVQILSAPVSDTTAENLSSAVETSSEAAASKTAVETSSSSSSATEKPDGNWNKYLPKSVNESLPANEFASPNSTDGNKNPSGPGAFDKFIPDMAGNYTKYSSKPGETKSPAAGDDTVSGPAKLGSSLKSSAGKSE